MPRQNLIPAWQGGFTLGLRTEFRTGKTLVPHWFRTVLHNTIDVWSLARARTCPVWRASEPDKDWSRTRFHAFLLAPPHSVSGSRCVPKISVRDRRSSNFKAPTSPPAVVSPITVMICFSSMPPISPSLRLQPTALLRRAAFRFLCLLRLAAVHFCGGLRSTVCVSRGSWRQNFLQRTILKKSGRDPRPGTANRTCRILLCFLPFIVLWKS